MIPEFVQVVSPSSSVHRYPVNHWNELSRFLVGEERDPKNVFCLSDDIWDAWPYATDGYPSKRSRYRFHFGHLRSFLKPYIKWYSYQRLLGKGRPLTNNETRLPNKLTLADTYCVEHDFMCLDDIASDSRFY